MVSQGLRFIRWLCLEVTSGVYVTREWQPRHTPNFNGERQNFPNHLISKLAVKKITPILRVFCRASFYLYVLHIFPRPDDDPHYLRN